MTMLVCANDLELRLARTEAEFAAAEALRYRVFCEELGAQASAEAHRRRRESDRFDPLCDHLIVVRRGEDQRFPDVVGSYRLLRGSIAACAGGFYTATEFDLSRLRMAPGDILELGRSCVAPEYRNGSVVQLLWTGIARYVDDHDIRLMLGCASLHGTDPDALAPQLSLLHHHHRAPTGLRPRALHDRYVPMARLARDAFDPHAVTRTLPPLLKAYLRVGAKVGDGAVIDHAFNTIDVCVVLPTAQVCERYLRHYRENAARVLVAA